MKRAWHQNDICVACHQAHGQHETFMTRVLVHGLCSQKSIPRRHSHEKAGIANWIAFYNDRRLHQALGYRAPMAVWRERMQAAKAVDMMDNAEALTTCPQQQQQTGSLAA
jgi:hypothetical protein